MANGSMTLPGEMCPMSGCRPNKLERKINIFIGELVHLADCMDLADCMEKRGEEKTLPEANTGI